MLTYILCCYIITLSNEAQHTGGNRMDKYTVYWVGSETGRLEGEIIKEFDNAADAINCAHKILKECGNEFEDCTFSGIGIDCNGKPMEW